MEWASNGTVSFLLDGLLHKSLEFCNVKSMANARCNVVTAFCRIPFMAVAMASLFSSITLWETDDEVATAVVCVMVKRFVKCSKWIDGLGLVVVTQGIENRKYQLKKQATTDSSPKPDVAR